MAILIDTGRRAGSFIAGESGFWRSRDHGWIRAGAGLLLAGTVMAATQEPQAGGTVLASPAAGNVGNGAITPTATPLDEGADAGTYTATLTTAAANGGTFTVRDPQGASLGTVAVGAAFDGPVNFTIADGTTDFALGDTFNIEAIRDDGLFAPFDPAGSGGVATAVGVLFDTYDATEAPRRVVLLTRDFEADDKMLVWPEGITATQKATAMAALMQRGIVVRTR